MVKFIILRHGFSTSNVDATFTGQQDAPLTEIGVKQGELASKYIYDNYNVSAIYSSDLSRAVNTVSLLSEKTGLKINTDKDLREVCGGDWEGRKITEIAEQYGDVYTQWITYVESARSPHGETLMEVQKRGLKALERIAKENENGTVVVVSHGGVIKTLQGAFLNAPMKEWNKIPWVLNASALVVNYENGIFSIEKIIDEYLGNLKTEMPKGI